MPSDISRETLARVESSLGAVEGSEHGGGACPSCGGLLPVAAGWVTWCPGCNWNLSAPAPPVPRTRFERAYLSAGDRLGRRLEDELGAVPELEPRLTPGKAAAFAIAIAVHTFTAGLALSGAFLLLNFASPPAVVLGLSLLSLAWLMRPRLGRTPSEDLVGREQAPTLFALIEEVAAALSTRPPALVVVNEDYNAFWNVTGIRRKRVLGLGLPLFDPLTPQERVAVIAHELGHGRNGDVTRGLVVGSALGSLSQLYAVMMPVRVDSAHWDGWIAIAQPITNAVLWVLSRPVWWLLYLEAHLVWRDSQRAEYLADALAAGVAGTGPEISMKERLFDEVTFDVISRQALHRPHGEPIDLFAELRAATAQVPGHERERRRRVARLEHARLNATHPPTGRRIALLQARPQREAAVLLTPQRSAQIDAELAPCRAELSARIIDGRRSALYSGRSRR